MGLNFLYTLFGLIFLCVGAELLVRSCLRLALSMRIPPLIIALTIVAFATSLPEAVTSAVAQLKDIPDIALGNIIGSNIANIGLVLAIAIIVYPTKSTSIIKNREIPIMLAMLLLLWGVMALGPIGWIKGIFLLALLIGYIIYQFTQKHEVHLEDGGRKIISILILIAGVALLIIGAEGLVTGATGIAKKLGISDRVIAITLIAIGTSLPELATSIIASYHRHTDIILGNILGSNIFNSLFITAIASFIRPIAFSPKMVTIDAPVMCGFALLLFFLARRRNLGRGIGITLLIGYITYLVWI